MLKLDEEKIKDIIKENDILRGLVANLKKPCHYCGLEDMSKCAYGFPGCALADDILIGSMTTETEMYKRWENESKEFEDYDDEYYFSHDATDWMKRQLKNSTEEFPLIACKAFVILDESLGGIYNLNIKLDKVEINKYFFSCVISKPLATYDMNSLTTLIFSAHDHCVRVELNPKSSWGYYELVFHNRTRKQADEKLSITKDHPTLEQAVEMWRYKNPNKRPIQGIS